jgi:DNA polymerase-3 subunit epsilon
VNIVLPDVNNSIIGSEKMNDEMKAIFAKRNFVVIDTETTGLHRPCEIIDIAILDSIGQVLFSQLLRPKEPISEFITDLTGITNSMVAFAPNWFDMKPYILHMIHEKDVITYNAKFDRHMMHCTDDMWELEQTDYKLSSNWYCAMEAYAPHHGVFDDYYNSFKWARLEIAMEEQGLTKEPLHRAESDAKMTYRLLEHMCL